VNTTASAAKPSRENVPGSGAAVVIVRAGQVEDGELFVSGNAAALPPVLPVMINPSFGLPVSHPFTIDVISTENVLDEGE